MTPPRPTPSRTRAADAPLSPAVEAIVAAIRAIPRGKTASYGEVAHRAGLPRGARQVARVLHALSAKRGLPWHRVINRNGCISLPMDGHGSVQAALLRKEGLAVDARGRVGASRGGAGKDGHAGQGGTQPEAAPMLPVRKGRPADMF